MKRVAQSCAALLLLIVPLGSVTRAEDTPPAPPTLEEHVQVTATRIPEKTSETPASVTVITREDLLRRGAYDLRSALALAAGIDIAPGGDGGPAGYVPEFWGLKEFDAFLLAVDGVPYGGAFNPALTTLDLNDIDRIEVLRGAAPVMYGATSFVGVINVIHVAPSETQSSIRATGGTYGSGGIAYRTPMPSMGGLGSSLLVDGQQQGFEDDRTEFSKAHVRWDASKTLDQGVLRFGLDSTWLQQDPASPHPREGTVLSPQVPLDANHNPGGSHINERRPMLNVSFENKFASGTWTDTLSVSQSDTGILRGFLTDLSGATPNANGFRQSIETTDIYFDSHMSLHPRTDVEVVAGVDYLHGDGEGHGGDFDYTVGLDGSGFPDGDTLADQASVRIEDRRDFSGLYGQIFLTPWKRWRFEVGGRVNYTVEDRTTHSVEFGNPPESGDDRRSTTRGSGFAGLTWTAWEQESNALHLYANYRNTYKPAAMDFGLDADPEILAPEMAESYEGGMKTRLLGDRLSLEVSAFQMDFRNLVISQVVGGLPELVNSGTTRFRGVDLEVVARATPATTWRVVYSLHDARFVDYLTEFGGVPQQIGGNRFEMTARHMAAGEFLYGRSTGWQGSVRANWVGSRYLNKRNTALAPDYITWSAGIAYRLKTVEIRIDGWNINNQRPPVAESELGDAQYYRLPARTLALSARWLLGGAPQ